MRAYADTNFLIRAYLDPDDGGHTAPLMKMLQLSGGPPVPVIWLLRVEFSNALQLVMRNSRLGGEPRVSTETILLAQTNFLDDLEQGVILRPVALSHEELTLRAESLIARHTAKHGFRTYDVLHVAAAQALRCDTLWTFDKGVKKLAKLEGLKTN